MNKFKLFKISDIANKIAMGPFGSNIKVSNFVSKGVPVLNGSNMVGCKLGEKSFNYVTEEKSKTLSNSIAHRRDIVITHRGTLGQIVYIPENSLYEKYIVSQSQFFVELKHEKIDYKYFTYFFHSHYGQYLLLSNASQVGVPALARPTSTFKELMIPVPPMVIQRKIVSILDGIDKKIELNTQINHNLEEQAKAIFKSWFVDFSAIGDTPILDIDNVLCPQGWSISSLAEIANYLNGLAMQKYRPNEDDPGYPVLKIKELRQGMCDLDSERCSSEIQSEYIVHDGDVIFSWSGSLLVDFWCGGDCGLNQHLFKVTSTNFNKWFFYSWTQHHLSEFIAIAADKATTMGHIKRENLQAAKVLVPPREIYKKIGLLLAPIYDAIIQNRIESKKLAQFRDMILPKLMSGEIDVSEIEV